MPEPEILTEREAAALLRVTVPTLRRWEGLPYFTLPTRGTGQRERRRYRRSEILAAIQLKETAA